MASSRRIETWFLIPLERESDGKKHAATLWGCLRREVYKVAGGWTGPETVHVIRQVEDKQGGWRDPETKQLCEDESRKYTVIIAEDDVEELRDVLRRAANSFDQKEILFMVRGVDKSVTRDPSDRYLSGDPMGG